MRVLQAPTNVANQAWALAAGLRELGHEAEVWHYGPNPFGFPCDRSIAFPPQRWTDLVRLISEALERFDVLHFHFGQSLVPRQVGSVPGLWDLPLYRNCGQRVFFTFHGSDVRRKSLHLQLDRWSYFRFAELVCDEDEILKRLKIIRTYANGLFVSSPIDRPFVPDASFHPRAIILEQWPCVGPVNQNSPLVVHAPSSRGTKGTEFVLRAVDEARNRGAKFEFRLLEGLPQAELRTAMQEADILIDNLLLGDYGVAGMEAMALGKTVITRLDDEVTRTMGEVPVLSADPETLPDVLSAAVRDADLRERLGKEGRVYVETRHSPRNVAGILLDAYEQPPPAVSLSFPDWAALADIRREERLEEQIRELTIALTSNRKTVILGEVRRGPCAVLGSRIDAILRRMVRQLRRVYRRPRRPGASRP